MQNILTQEKELLKEEVSTKVAELETKKKEIELLEDQTSYTLTKIKVIEELLAKYSQ